MKQFESRSVLDRIEIVWNMFFSSRWQVRVLPQIVIITISTIVGFASLIPLFFFLPDFQNWEMLDSAGQMFLITKMLSILLIPITIFTLQSGLLFTYTLSVSHDYTPDKTWKDYISLAWSRLWGWAWYGFWVTIFMILIFGTGVISFIISPLIFGFLTVILFVLFFWVIGAMYAGAPEYILANSWHPKRFLEMLSLTSGRWWRVFGNMLLVSVVVGSVLSMIQQLIYQIMGLNKIGTYLATLVDKPNFDWNQMIVDISPDIGTRFIFGAILLFVLATGQQVFVTMFQYVVWKDIKTDLPDEESKATE